MRCVIRTGIHLFALAVLPGTTLGQTASVAFEESIAVYGPEIFPAITDVALCGNFRVLVAYVNGTDLLFVDELAPANNGSTFRVIKSFGFIEFNYYEAAHEISEISCRRRDSDSLEIMGRGYEGHRNAMFDFTVELNTVSGEYRYSDSLD